MAENALVAKEQRTDLTRPEPVRETVTFTPRCDILDTPDEVIVYADLPGVEPKDVDVRFERGELTIHGVCAPRQEGVNYLTCEYDVGDFHRVFTVGEEIDADKITAEIKQGVLTVHLPKSETVRPKRIQVKGE